MGNVAGACSEALGSVCTTEEEAPQRRIVIAKMNTGTTNMKRSICYVVLEINGA